MIKGCHRDLAVSIVCPPTCVADELNCTVSVEMDHGRAFESGELVFARDEYRSCSNSSSIDRELELDWNCFISNPILLGLKLVSSSANGTHSVLNPFSQCR